MPARTSVRRRAEAIVQFSVFTPNRLGRLNDMICILSTNSVSVLALSVLDSTDSAIIRFVVDDPDHARELLDKYGFPHAECELVAVEVDSATQLGAVMSALLEAELNVNYLYTFIPHPQGKSILALSMEDNDMAEEILKKHQFRVLKQSDISR